MSTRQGHIIDGFNLIAPAYDTTADILTLGLHRIWRNQFCKIFLKKTPKNAKLLDLGTGTGEIIFRCLSNRPDIEAFGLDLSEGMLKQAKEKLNKKSLFYRNKIHFQLGNALQIPYQTNFFDTVTISWSVRSFRPIQGALREVLRVLKPGGSLFILEHGLPEMKIVRNLIHKYGCSAPLIGEKIAESKHIYPLFKTNVEGFSSGKNFAAELFEAGFFKVHYKAYSSGVIYIYEAQKSSN